MSDTVPPEAWLTGTSLRIARHGTELLDGLTLRLTEPRAVLVGDGANAIAYLFARKASMVSGTLTLFGKLVSELESLSAGAILPEGSLPTHIRTRDVIALASLIAQGSHRIARRDSETILEALGLTSLANTRLSALGVAEKRGIQIAQALALYKKVLVIHEPLRGLDGTQAAHISELIGRIPSSWQIVITMNSLAGAAAQTLRAIPNSQVVSVSRGDIRWSGRACELGLDGGSLWMNMKGPAERGAALLNQLGVSYSGTGPWWIVSLPPGLSRTALLAAAADSGAVITELLELGSQESSDPIGNT